MTSARDVDVSIPPLHGRVEIEVSSDGFFLEGVEGGVAKNLPPGGAGNVIPWFCEFPSPGNGNFDRGPLIVRTQFAGGQKETEAEDQACQAQRPADGEDE